MTSNKADHFKKLCATQQVHSKEICLAIDAIKELEDKLRLANNLISKIKPTDMNQRQMLNSYRIFSTT
jgi:hypothetical protein